MKLIHASLALVALLPLPATHAQPGPGRPSAPSAPAAAPAKPLAFAVISVKLNHSGLDRQSLGMNRDGFTATNIDVHTLLLAAFRLQEDDQLVGEPKWTNGERWNIDARIEPQDIPALAKMNFEQRMQMFQQILTQCFALKVHHETRVLPVYALVVAPGGPKMTPSKPEPSDPNGIPGYPGELRPSHGKETARGALLFFLAEDLSDALGRKVVDKTGLTGRYDFTLTWAPDEDAAAMGNTAAAQGPSLFTAVQEQLGLKLISTKTPVDVIVVDHIEKAEQD